MSTTTPINGLTIPVLGDVADIEVAMSTFGAQLDSRILARYATTAERDTANPAPTTGQICWVTSTFELYLRTTTAWTSAVPRMNTKLTATSRTAATLVADPDLILSVEADSKYSFKVGVFYEASVAGDIQWQLVGPPGSTVLTGYIVSPVAAVAQEAIIGATLAGGGSAGIGTANNFMYSEFHANVVTVGTSGVLALYWGMAVASGTATVHAGSAIESVKYA